MAHIRSIFLFIIVAIFVLFILYQSLIWELVGKIMSTDPSFKYSIKNNVDKTTSTGLRLDIPRQYLHHMKYPALRTVRLTKKSAYPFVLVTAGSNADFSQSLESVAAAQAFFPSRWILYYDVGLLPSQLAKVKTLCSVIYRRFDFHQSPDHFLYMRAGAWKPFIIQDSLQEFGGVLYFDSSVAFTDGDLSPMLKKAVKNNGITVGLRTEHSIIEAAHADTFKYLPMQAVNARNTPMLSAETILIYNTHAVQENVMKWYMACSMVEKCIMPVQTPRELDCSAKKYGHGHCLRFDTAVLNIVLANYYMYKTERLRYEGIFHVRPSNGSGTGHPVQVCDHR